MNSLCCLAWAQCHTVACFSSRHGGNAQPATTRRRRESFNSRQLRKRHESRLATGGGASNGGGVAGTGASTLSGPRLVPVGQGSFTVGTFGKGGNYG